MAINFEIYSNANASSKSVSVDFFSDIVADSKQGITSDLVYYFKFTTGARDTDNLAYTQRLTRDLSDLALNGEAQSATNTSSQYTNVKTMVTDYVYDYIHGHTAGQFGTSVTKKAPMKFN